MSDALINIESKDGIETVNARELHEFLYVGRDFSNWIKQRIEKYGFIEGIDFTPELAKSVGGRPEKIYHISIDMAKELSMVENNERGREARRYFIECERQAKSPSIPELTEAEIVQRAMIIQQKKIEQLSIKAQVADELARTKGLFLPSMVGKMIMGKPNVFCQWLVDHKIMYRKGASHKLVPVSPLDRKEKGYFHIQPTVFGDNSTAQTYFTARGIAWIQAKYLKKNNLLSLDYSDNMEGIDER